MMQILFEYNRTERLKLLNIWRIPVEILDPHDIPVDSILTLVECSDIISTTFDGFAVGVIVRRSIPGVRRPPRNCIRSEVACHPDL